MAKPDSKELVDLVIAVSLAFTDEEAKRNTDQNIRDVIAAMDRVPGMTVTIDLGLPEPISMEEASGGKLAG